ncbi:C40 family peptidase [Lysinibacter cavernae]|uniref:Cell wall-associated NlpC family hydrolase n=1 Tax=Lysinibacter cavernae TaxID=1640652 RepID=A0A7X5TTZ4_9MICO|nr:C40 family peptidase [Lysinibacter cavernae]NIH54715.1 cell wall-associated NlpC family hydrolase [Lysinibacter cavernae]
MAIQRWRVAVALGAAFSTALLLLPAISMQTNVSDEVYVPSYAANTEVSAADAKRPAAFDPESVSPSTLASIDAEVADHVLADLQAQEAAALKSNAALLTGPVVMPADVDPKSVVGLAYSKIGSAYVFGATGASTFDCSGLTQWVYGQTGVSIPHYTEAQYASGRVVSAADARPGDVVYKPGHVGIYIGGNEMIHAGNEATGVEKSSIWFTPTFLRFGE